MPVLWKFIKWRFGISNSERNVAPYVPEYAVPDTGRIQNPDHAQMQITWVGHSTFLIQLAGMNILTDPIWGERASPVSWAGPKRYARPGLRFEDLPRIDVVLISHTHYDHLDRPTILRLGNGPRYIVPTRVHEWFAREHITNATELSWWESTKFDPLTIHAVPAKHWSKRKFFSDEHMGWGGYVIESAAGTIYFAGDTGYHSEYFKQIGKRFPGIDLGLIPIGAYYPREVFGNYHIDPHEALVVHKEVGAKRSIGMHWGTFKLTQEPLAEPPMLLVKEREALHVSPEGFSTMKIGETRSILASRAH